jgi:protein arginine kinase activator
MKCQKCEKPATFHITDLTGEELVALHLCPECAREYLQPPANSPASSSLAGLIAQQLKLGQTADMLAELDKRQCPVCGISFYEFRQSGRLGCPHDYTFFSNELEPLLANVHGQAQHTGKVPKHRPGSDTETQTQLIRLRREMRQAIEQEDYEAASRLRDNIRQIENRPAPPTVTTETTSSAPSAEPSQSDSVGGASGGPATAGDGNLSEGDP